MSVNAYRKRNTMFGYASRIPLSAYYNLGKKAYNAYSSYGPATKAVAKKVRTMSKYKVKVNQKTKRRTITKKPSKTAKLAKKVSKLARSLNADQGTHIIRKRECHDLICSVNGAVTVAVGGTQMSDLDLSISGLRYYDPIDPAILVTADGRLGGYLKQFNFKNIDTKITIRNNYQMPVVITLYLVCPKVDTSIDPVSAISQGLADVGAPSPQSPLVYPTDSPQFTDLWTICRTKTKYLDSGQSMKDSYHLKDILYDPSLFDSHTDDYQKPYGNHKWMIRMVGTLSHHPSSSLQGVSLGGIDYQLDSTYKITYSAGADITTIVVTDESQAITPAAVVSSKPTVDNIAFSQA